MACYHTSMQNNAPFERMRILYGDEAMERLYKSRVALLGIGGVGGHCAEALARSGIGHITLIDGDRVQLSNINRQAVAFHSTVGQYKSDIMRDRILDIRPEATVRSIPAFFGERDDLGLFSEPYDLIIDAIDDIPAKVALAALAQREGLRCLSCMGAGNKTGAVRFTAADLYETHACPMARAMRKAARARGVSSLRVIYSSDPPIAQKCPQFDEISGRPIPGSVVFVTATAGLALAGEAVRMLLETPYA